MSTLRTFNIGEDGEEVTPRRTYSITGVQQSSGDYCRAEDALALESEMDKTQKLLAIAQDNYEEEKSIVNRIWSMFGNPAYEFLDGKSIYDLVQDGLDAIQLLGKYRESHIQSNGQQCYVNFEQGDYRCSDCIEADRITGMQRKLNEMSTERVARLRESLAKPNNGL